MKPKTFLLTLASIGLAAFALSRLCTNVDKSRFAAAAQPAIPRALTLQDYQTPEDARIMRWLYRIEESRTGRRLDATLVKPLFDDPNTGKLAAEGVEATPSQFVKLDEAVRISARILHIPKPRVFVRQHADLPITVENYSEPVMVVDANMLQQFHDAGELRFLVGRELAHIASHHIRWISLLRQTKPTLENNGFVGKAVTSALQEALSKWVQECQITSDRGGLICSQDIRASERALVKVATGFGESEMASVNMDEYVVQSAPAQRETMTIQGRIRQLQEYQKSSVYSGLWK